MTGHDAKILAMSVSRIKEECSRHDMCQECPFWMTRTIEDKKTENYCIASMLRPREWDLDEIVFNAGYLAGSEEREEEYE